MLPFDQQPTYLTPAPCAQLLCPFGSATCCPTAVASPLTDLAAVASLSAAVAPFAGLAAVAPFAGLAVVASFAGLAAP